MSKLFYVKASDVECDFCFLEVSQIEGAEPFMDIRISDEKELSFYLYPNKTNVALAPEQWLDIHEQALSFYQSEIANEESFTDWVSKQVN